MTGYGASIKSVERLELKEAIEKAIANGKTNAWILRAFAPVPFKELPYSRLVRIKEEMGFEYADIPKRVYRPRAGSEPKKLQPCGTEAAYRRHKAAGEEPCQPCTVARKAGRRARLESEKASMRKRALTKLVDSAAVEAAMAGHRVKLKNAERAEVIRRLHAFGYPAWMIAERLGLATRTVARHLSVLRSVEREEAA